MKETYNVTKNALINVPVPELTRTYRPVSHLQLIDYTLEGINRAGFTLGKELYSSASDGLVANGRYTIQNVSDNEMQLQVSWRNSYNKTLPLVFSLGCMVLVCSNGMQRSMGMGGFKRKHQAEIQEYTPNAIFEYIKQGADVFMKMQEEREAMKQIELTRTVQAEIIGRMFIEAEFIKSTQLNIVKRELDNPTHNYGDPNSLWSLYQYSTFAMREIHPSLYLQDHIDAHNFFTSFLNNPLPENQFQEAIVIEESKSPYKQLDWTEEIARMRVEYQSI